MYSYEDRIRAVELYVKLGKRVREIQSLFVRVCMGALRPNVRGNRTASLAAQPPSSVAGPCWPAS